MDDEIAENLSAHFDKREIEEIAAVITLFVDLNRWNTGKHSY
jgi:hypothetical protein